MLAWSWRKGTRPLCLTPWGPAGAGAGPPPGCHWQRRLPQLDGHTGVFSERPVVRHLRAGGGERPPGEGVAAPASPGVAGTHAELCQNPVNGEI